MTRLRRSLVGIIRLYAVSLYGVGFVLMCGAAIVSLYATYWLISDLSRLRAFMAGEGPSGDLVGFSTPFLGITVGYGIFRLGKSLLAWTARKKV